MRVHAAFIVAVRQGVQRKVNMRRAVEHICASCGLGCIKICGVVPFISVFRKMRDGAQTVVRIPLPCDKATVDPHAKTPPELVKGKIVLGAMPSADTRAGGASVLAVIGTVEPADIVQVDLERCRNAKISHLGPPHSSDKFPLHRKYAHPTANEP